MANPGFFSLFDFTGIPIGYSPNAIRLGRGFHGLSWVLYYQMAIEEDRKRSILDHVLVREFRNNVETAIFNKVLKVIDQQVKKKKRESIAAYTVLLMEA